ncbi:MAG: hypothetical protein OD814_001244 [Candidatus Alkanophagales archaeon MCA70_species_1]|nr:hypothetical protein [Candidatus Alkanophaga volatiphilum]
MEEYEKPELEIRVKKHGITKLFPLGMLLDILPLKFKLIVYSRGCKQPFKFYLECSGFDVLYKILKPKEEEVLEYTFTLRLEPGRYRFWAITECIDPHDPDCPLRGWGHEIQGVTEFRVIDGRSLVLGLLISLVLTLLLNGI